MNTNDFCRPTLPATRVAEHGAQATADHWKDALAALSSEISEPLSAALGSVQQLMDTGGVDRAILHSLHTEIQRARSLSMIGQQLGRLASGRAPQTAERLSLDSVLQDALTTRSREVEGRGITLVQARQPVEIFGDASLLFNLIDALLNWSLKHAASSLELQLDVKPWPAHARLVCQFAHSAHDCQAAPSELPAESLDSLTWHLLQQTARAMRLVIERKIDSGHVVLALEFPKIVKSVKDRVSPIELDAGYSPAISAKPLTGSQVLVVASRRDVRIQIRDAIRNMGLVVDFVNSVEEAREFCLSGLPHAIVIESLLRGASFNRFRREIDADGRQMIFIEILEEGGTFEISGFGGLSMARVGRDAILTSLPSALTFELSKRT